MSSYTYIHASQRTPGALPGLSHRGLCHAMQGTETHALGHQGNGLVCWTSQVKQPDILSWGPSPTLPVAIYLILKSFRFAHACCVFPAWFLSRAGKAEVTKKDILWTSLLCYCLSDVVLGRCLLQITLLTILAAFSLPHFLLLSL